MKRQKLNRRVTPPYTVSPRAVSRILHEFLQTLGLNLCATKSIKPLSFDADPSSMTAAEFARAYLYSEIFSKFDDGKPSSEKTLATLERFHAAEGQCRTTNEFLKTEASSKRVFTLGDGQQIIWSARQKIARLLGDFKWNDAERHFGWGPGATTRLSRRQSHAAYKYSGRPDTSEGNAALANACIMRSPLWQEGLEFREGTGFCNIVAGNRIISVPKNYKVDRMIAIEPDMNMYVQKGIGALIRRRLKRVGIDLDSQEHNQDAAFKGSVTGATATLDLSMASDTISIEVVRQLLPPDWFEALGLCRCQSGVLTSSDGSSLIRYEKFSSMGNGYTFELETLIFWATAQAVTEVCRGDKRLVLVYGDDLVVPVSTVPLLMDTLKYLGFTPNAKKSHWSGPFRESCGKHFHGGHDVSPFYVKHEVSTLSDLFLLHNQIYRWCKRMHWDVTLPREELRRICGRLRELAPTKWRKPRIPDGFGDGAFIGTFDECTPRRARDWLDGYQVKHLAAVSESLYIDDKGYLISSLIGARGSQALPPDGSSKGGVALPPRIREVESLVKHFQGLDPF